jgi:hypothetical protein
MVKIDGPMDPKRLGRLYLTPPIQVVKPAGPMGPIIIIFNCPPPPPKWSKWGPIGPEKLRSNLKVKSNLNVKNENS